MNLDARIVSRLQSRLRTLYGERDQVALQRILEITAQRTFPARSTGESRWNERDVVLITYPDQVQCAESASLSVLARFIDMTELNHLFSTVHILPFFPYSSDDGFSVIDYRLIDPPLGGWEDIRRLGQRMDLMFDLVLNHVSQHSSWFQRYLAGEEPYTRYFMEVDPTTDLSAVTRPRNLPLLTPQETSQGKRYVWTTFSADQIDLNYAEPEVLVEMLDILLFYVEQGARIIRLDAIAYLWKRVGTPCIHLRETHEIVKLIRDVLDVLAPHVVLLTETNVPHEENISYFANGDEAHMVYQFSLPPLLLDAFLNEDTKVVVQWLSNLGTTPPGTTYFNFTASHDGIGVRPLEGQVPRERVENLVQAVKTRGGYVSTRRTADGRHLPYELNTTYYDALGETGQADTDMHVRRFLASQAIMLSVRGIPGIYFHSLVGTPNHVTGVEESGQPRRINRRRYELDELMARVSDPRNPQSKVFNGYRELLQIRIQQPAFHPDGAQIVHPTDNSRTIAYERISPDGEQRILVIANLSRVHQSVDISGWVGKGVRDLLSGETALSTAVLTLDPWKVLWLEVL